MKRNTQEGGEETEVSKGTCNGSNSKSSSKNNDNTNSNNKHRSSQQPPPLPPPPIIDTVSAVAVTHPAAAPRGARQHPDDTSVPTATWNQPMVVIIKIFHYADQETLRRICLVSQQFLDIVRNAPGMEHHRAIPLLEIRPSPVNEDDGERIQRLVHQLIQHRDKLQRYGTLRMIDPDKFNGRDWGTIETMMEQLRLNGIVSLEMAGECNSTNGMIFVLSRILPNLQEINLSNTGFGYEILHLFSQRRTRLEKVTWNNINRSAAVCILGSNIRFKNLKEIYMDDCVFEYRCFISYFTPSLDLENDERPDEFLFHQCSKVLERVSIRNAKYVPRRNLFETFKTRILPQNVLIGFVRNSPQSLRWFRSSLTNENMIMLRSERPGIELLN